MEGDSTPRTLVSGVNGRRPIIERKGSTTGTRSVLSSPCRCSRGCGCCLPRAWLLGCDTRSPRHSLCLQSELQDATLLPKAEFVFSGEPSDPHMQEAFRQGRSALELAQRHLAMLRKILPNPARGLANLCIHRVLLQHSRGCLVNRDNYTCLKAKKGENYCSLQLEVSGPEKCTMGKSLTLPLQGGVMGSKLSRRLWETGTTPAARFE